MSSTRKRSKTTGRCSPPPVATLDLGSFNHGQDDSTQTEPPVCLTRRRDPSESFSDWTIVVKSINDESTSTYHVHKHVVGAGPRASKYFLRLFQTEGLAESSTSTSTFELEGSAAIAFPSMLDYMYGHRSESLSATSEIAVALRHLANYFTIPALFDAVNSFIQKDMSTDNVIFYWKEADLYKDEKITDATKDFAVKRFRWLSTDDSSSYLELMTPTAQKDLLARALTEAVETGIFV